MVKVLFLAYPKYADFEIAHTLFFLRKLGKAIVTTATIDGRPVVSIGGINTLAQMPIFEVNPEDYNLILISGGDGIPEVLENEDIQLFLRKAYSLKKPIAAICASATLLGKAGLLKGKKFTCTTNTFEQFKEVFQGGEYTGNRIEVLDHIITAKGTAFPKFTVAVIDKLNLWKNDEQRQAALQFCKGDVG